MRGDGRVYKRKRSPFWWIEYWLRGEQYRESTGVPISDPKGEEKARKALRNRLREVGADQIGARPFVGPAQERLKVGDLLDALETHYQINKKDSPQFRAHVKQVREAFGDWRAVSLTAEAVEKYIERRLAEGRASATINRETQLLGQAFRLAVERRRLATMPVIHKLPENNVREGFFEKPDFEAVVFHLPEYLKDFCRWAYLTGWRKSEVASLGWEDVDVYGRLMRLRRLESKNGEPRRAPLEGELWDIIERRSDARQIQGPNGETILSPLVFHRKGAPVGDFRKAWATACEKAGVPGKLVHDFCRTAIRNMIRGGVSPKVAREFAGRKTDAILNRYNITSEDDLRDAVHKTLAYVEKLPAERNVLSFSKSNEGDAENPHTSRTLAPKSGKGASWHTS